MGKPTEKMVYALQKMGIDASNMTFEQASETISKLKGAVTKPYKPLDSAYNSWQKQAKPTSNPSSQYVSYAKDLTIAMLNVHAEARKQDSKIEPIAVDKLAETATAIIKQIVKEFD